MSKVRLSSTQIWVLEKLCKGEILHHISGFNARCFFSDSNVSWPTILRLENIGLVKRTSNKIELTEFGKTFNNPKRLNP